MMYKKLIAFLLVMVMVLSCLAGCNNDPVETTGKPDPGPETQPGTGETTPVVQEPVEFEFYAKTMDPYPLSSPIWDALAEATNVEVTYTWIDSEAFDTTLATRIADKDLPDVISGSGGGELIRQLKEDGLIIPLTDLLEEKMPNFCSYLSEEDWAFLRESDGEIYKLGYMVDVPGLYCYTIRQDWLEKIGKDVPETWDEWVEVWTLFKEQDMNGNGDPNDEIPFAFNYGWIYHTMSIFGINSNSKYSVTDDGHYVLDPEHPRYNDWLQAMHELYEKGLISPEYLTMTSKVVAAGMAGDLVGSAVVQVAAGIAANEALAEVNPDAFFVNVAPIEGPDGHQGILRRPKLTLNTYITKAAVDEGKLDAILGFFDYLYSDEGILLTNYGIEGETYDMVDGKPVFRAAYGTGYGDARAYGLIPSVLPFYFSEEVFNSHMFNGETDPSKMDAIRQNAYAAMTDLYTEYYYTWPPQFTTEAQSEYADLLTAHLALRDQYIMGQISWDDYLTGYQDLKDQGLIEILEAVDAEYQMVK